MVKKIDSIISNDLVKTDNKKENDTGKLNYKKITPKLNPNKTNWEVVAFVGASNTVEKALTSSNNSSLYDQPSNLSTSNPGGFTQVNLLAPTARISFGFNLKRIQSISKKMAWYGSFGYKYLSNHQASGAFVDSSKIIGFDSLALLVSTAKTDRVPSYFKYGNTLNHNNYAHLLNVSAGLKYNVSKAFSLNGGIAIGYQIKSKWLQPDTKQSILYYSNKLTNKWNIGATIGVDYKLRKFSIGVFYNYDFTKTSLSNTPQNVHWQNFGATISIPLSFHK